MKNTCCLFFFLFSIACFGQDKIDAQSIQTKAIHAKSATESKSTISDPIIRSKNELPLSSKTNPEVFTIEKDKPKLAREDSNKPTQKK